MPANISGFSGKYPSYLIRLLGLAINGGVPLIAIVALLHNSGVWAVFLVPVVFLIVVPILDLIVGERCVEDGDQETDPVFELFLYIQIPFHLMIFIGAIWVAVTADLPLWARIVEVVGFGLVNGQATLIGHEFAHKPERRKRIAAQIALATVGMGHFLLEHVRGHHIFVATPEDCASARLGESIYAFAMRDMVGEIVGGHAHEAKRLRGKGMAAMSWQNRILQSYALSLAIAALLVFLLGWEALPWIILHHIAAWFTLTLITYIEHYGLLRQMLPDGRREAVQRIHTWDTDAMISNMLLLNVQRHADHHARPMKPYQSLRVQDDGPRLPTGYFGMIVLALFPPLWRLVMDARVVSAVQGNVARLHLVGSPDRRVARLILRSEAKP